ncbi:Transposase_IS4 [Hexamita inflata]|uniref:Transposase IS4 n=1 Tax=Hexamita inflata TaxID=28002 RepID=A0AA86NTR9_9EUKA|nr:Transposase IS4 [Hexamita inflata]
MSSQDALRLLQQYLNKDIVGKLITLTQSKLQQNQVNNRSWKQNISFDESTFWKFIDVILVMFLSPRSNIDEYWSNSEILGNIYVKKIFSRDTFNHYYLSISWEEDDNNLSDNWFQKQNISFNSENHAKSSYDPHQINKNRCQRPNRQMLYV